MILSPSSNCEDDADTFLLSTESQQSGASPEIPPTNFATLPSCSAAPSFTDALLAAAEDVHPNSSLQVHQNKNITAYIADCHQRLVGKLDHQDISQIFTRNKQFDDNSALIFPSKALSTCVERMEHEHVSHPHFLLQPNVMANTVNHISSLSALTQFKCSQCSLARKIVALFVNIRVNFALRLCCRQFAQPNQKRNRKVLKFSHQ